MHHSIVSSNFIQSRIFCKSDQTSWFSISFTHHSCVLRTNITKITSLIIAAKMQRWRCMSHFSNRKTLLRPRKTESWSDSHCLQQCGGTQTSISQLIPFHSKALLQSLAWNKIKQTQWGMCCYWNLIIVTVIISIITIPTFSKQNFWTQILYLKSV